MKLFGTSAQRRDREAKNAEIVFSAKSSATVVAVNKTLLATDSAGDRLRDTLEELRRRSDEATSYGASPTSADLRAISDLASQAIGQASFSDPGMQALRAALREQQNAAIKFGKALEGRGRGVAD